MITKDEIAAIMELMTAQTIRARENAVRQDRGALKNLVESEIKENLDPEWNYALKRVLEMLDQPAPTIHPVMSADDLNNLTQRVSEKIARLVPSRD
jgi:tRNA U34 5-carboxymethylaminomethyl modifying GTPase MnmE/TrmE